MSINKLIESANQEHNPIIRVKDFIMQQKKYEETSEKDKWRLVGYVLKLAYDSATIVTNDTLKKYVGGIPRGSFLIMVPSHFEDVEPHFTLLRVKAVASTPLEGQVQETYFEMQKRSMPELDIWTQSELQWGALDCDVLGMFYGSDQNKDKLCFSGDVNNIVSPHMYEVYAPNDEILELIVNGIVKNEDKKEIGYLRTMECEFGIDKNENTKIPVEISMKDFMGCRTAMFGKTRLGKSNVVKIIAQSMIDSTKNSKNVGQLIFDINGEYANDNPQDNNSSIYSANKERCEVYALNNGRNKEAKPLRLNFFENPSECFEIIKNLLEEKGKKSDYVSAFSSVVMPSFDNFEKLDFRERYHFQRKVQIYWSILHEAGFSCNETKLSKLLSKYNYYNPFKSVCGLDIIEEEKIESNDLNTLSTIYKRFAKKLIEVGEIHKKDSKDNYFDSEEISLLKFLVPGSGRSGPMMLKQFIELHDKNADDITDNIIKSLDEGKTVILDLGNATDYIRKFFSDMLSKRVFSNQETKFVSNKLENTYVQLYFEEAHNLFPPNDKNNTTIYSRFAKEGAKFHIGMVYSTQSPSTISQELLVQTENFFVGHLASSGETLALTKQQIAFSGIEEDILRARTPGFMRMLTLSHRFVIPVQANLYKPIKEG